jgi:hypothetical protein
LTSFFGEIGDATVRAAFFENDFGGAVRVSGAPAETKTLLHGFEILSALLLWISLGCLHT